MTAVFCQGMTSVMPKHRKISMALAAEVLFYELAHKLFTPSRSGFGCDFGCCFRIAPKSQTPVNS